MILIALLAATTFLIAVPFLFVDLAKTSRELAVKNKELEMLKVDQKAAKKARDFPRANEIERQIDEKSTNSTAQIIVSGFGCCFSVLGQLVLVVLELVLIITVLVSHIGNPVFGFIALGAWAFMIVYSFYNVKQTQKAMKAAKAVGNTYLQPSTHPILKIIGFVPDLYALYILVIIGVITTAAG